MTEHESSAELLTPQHIFEQYLNTSPRISVGQIELHTLNKWRQRLETAELIDPQEQLLAAWITTELGFAHYFSDQRYDGIPAPVDLFNSAMRGFKAVVESPYADRLQRGQACAGRGASDVWRTIARGLHRPNETLGSVLHYNRQLAQAAEYILQHGQETGSARAAMWADGLTIAMLSTDSTGAFEDMLFPASPRHVSPDIDGFYRYNAYGLRADKKGTYQVRVANNGPGEFVVVSPDLLGQHAYPSVAGYGTLQALMHREEVVNFMGVISGQPKERMIKKIDRSAAHVTPVATRLRAYMTERRNMDVAGAETFDQDPHVWFNSVHPGRLPFLIDAERLDLAISSLEMRLAEEDLTPFEAMELAWMYTEVALGRAVDSRTPTTVIRGDISRSEDVFRLAMEKLEAPEDSLAYCEASFGFAALPMYEAVLCRDDIDLEMVGTYCDALFTIGERAIARCETLKTDAAEAIALDALVQRITLCLLVHMEGDRNYVGLTSTPRQQDANGWDVNIWSLTNDGFVPRTYGRIRIAEKEDNLTLADGIVTVTPAHLAQKNRGKRFVTFQAMASEFRNPGNMAANKQIAKAWKTALRAVAAAEV